MSIAAEGSFHMSVSAQQTSRQTIWEHHRPGIIALGRALHALLDTPGVTFHGRDLRPEDEGVGIQFQYCLDLGARRAYIAIDVQLVEQGVGLAWRVATLQIIQQGDRDYRFDDRQTHTLPLRQRDGLRVLFRDVLTPAANEFFTSLPAPSSTQVSET
jgi:hypothetical protein